MNRIADPVGMCTHSDAMVWVTQLVIDLKKQLLGYPIEPITMQRLDEWTNKHHRDLEKCRDVGKVY